MTLEQFFQENPKGALAFSGGVDSAFLLWAGLQAGAAIQPYFVKTQFQPQFELEDAKKLCWAMDAELVILEVDILSDGQIAANPPDRCYHCKRRLLATLRERAAADGFSLLMDGTNASDDGGDRPGMRALEEMGFRSPLRECGLTKRMIRKLSRQAGLFTWDKPSYACLATRIPEGRAIVRSDLEKAEMGEVFLSGLGFRDFRLRLTREGAKLQVAERQFPLVLARQEEILCGLEPMFREITLDLRPRTGTD